MSDIALHGKRLQLLKEAAPKISRVAVITYKQGPNDRGDWRRQLDAAAAAQKVDIVWLAVDAIYATVTHVNAVFAARIANFALEHRLPSIGFAAEGMLLSYDSDDQESAARCGLRQEDPGRRQASCRSSSRRASTSF